MIRATFDPPIYNARLKPKRELTVSQYQLKLYANGSLDDYKQGEGLYMPHLPVTELDQANLVSSEIVLPEGVQPHHIVAIDLDIPAQLIPSSTPGHSHLYIDKPMTWRVYANLLKAMADAGIIEQGYYGASMARGSTTLRLPWVKKPSVDADDPFPLKAPEL